MGSQYMNNIDKYFEVNKLVNDYLRDDISFEKLDEKLNYLENAKSILSTEVLTLYDYLDKRNLINDYKNYLNGNDDYLPFDE